MRLLRGEEEGPGLPILLIHGGGSDNAGISWFRLIGPLSKHCPVIAPDLAGFGGTEDVPVTGTAAGMADQLRQLLDEIGIPRVLACGVSMGGEVAFQFALRHPQYCAAVVAIAPGGFVERFRSPAMHRVVWWSTLIPEPVLRPVTALANRFTRSLVRRMVRHPESLPPQVVDEMVREAKRPGSGTAYATYNKRAIGPEGMRNYLIPAVAALRMPTLFFHGANDPLVPPAGSQLAVDLMPNARLVLVPDCGHWA
ncbi:MAG: alpha/beta fold hydrolase, partial [bacterium]|nr:alpha/beta fold hydrolase [bacterium]